MIIILSFAQVTIEGLRSGPDVIQPKEHGILTAHKNENA